jgi:hypothetical protein
MILSASNKSIKIRRRYVVSYLLKKTHPAHLRGEKTISIKKNIEKIKDDCRFWQHQNYTETTKNIKEEGKEGA